MNREILRAIDSETWAIRGEWLDLIRSIAARESDIETMVGRIRAEHRGLAGDRTALHLKSGVRHASAQSAVIRGNVGVLPLYGPLMPRANMMTDYSGATSLQRAAVDLSALVEDSSIASIVLDVDSPGGSVSQTADFAAAVRAAAQVKPVVAHTAGLMCSAAYWIAAAAGEVVASPSGLIGSVGVVTVRHVQVEPGSDGYQEYEIVSSNAANKRPDVRTDEGLATIRDELDALETVFVSALADYRGISVDTVLETFGQGGVFETSAALALGMIDRMASLEEVVSGLASATTSENSSAPHITSLAASGGVIQPVAGYTDFSAISTQEKNTMTDKKNDPATPAAPSIQTAEDLRAQFPDQVSALENDATAAATKSAAESARAEERARIAAINDATLPGFGALAATHIADGTSPADFALAQTQAQKKQMADVAASAGARESDLTGIDNGQGLPAPAAPPAARPGAGGNYEGLTDDEIKAAAAADWTASADLRADFPQAEDYAGFVLAESRGAVSLLTKG